jgi:apolipoprotein N-acyltransferase
MVPSVCRTAPWCGDALALLVGALMPLAFAPLGLWPLAVVALAVLFGLWARDPRRQAWRGGLFGLGMFGAGVYWLYISIHEFGNAPLALAAGLTLVLVAFLALFPALVGLIAARIPPTPFNRIVTWPAAWVLVEWVRGWILTGFPWLAVGYSQIDTPLAGYGPVLGVYGVGWALVLSAALLALVVDRGGLRLRVGALVGLLTLWVLGWGLGRIEWTAPRGETLTASLIQGNITQDVKWSPTSLVQTLERYREMTHRAWDSDLILWPETAVPAFLHSVYDRYVAPLHAEAKAEGRAVLIGAPVLDTADDRYYNSLLAFGSGEGVYSKRHLVPFGEYIPLSDLVAPVMSMIDIPLSEFSPGGADDALIRVGGFQFAASICYEDIFGEEVARGLDGADALINVSNDAWFGDSAAPHQHLQMARMRAIETGRYMLRATNTGVSAVIDPTGRIVARSPQFAPDILTAEIEAYAGATPYVVLGNWPVLVLLGLTGIWARLQGSSSSLRRAKWVPRQPGQGGM